MGSQEWADWDRHTTEVRSGPEGQPAPRRPQEPSRPLSDTHPTPPPQGSCAGSTHLGHSSFGHWKGTDRASTPCQGLRHLLSSHGLCSHVIFEFPRQVGTVWTPPQIQLLSCDTCLPPKQAPQCRKVPHGGVCSLCGPRGQGKHRVTSWRSLHLPPSRLSPGTSWSQLQNSSITKTQGGDSPVSSVVKTLNTGAVGSIPGGGAEIQRRRTEKAIQVKQPPPHLMAKKAEGKNRSNIVTNSIKT